MIALAAEQVVFLDQRFHDQVAARGTAIPCFAFSTQRKLHTVKSAGWDRNLKSALGLNSPFAEPSGARIGDNCSPSATSAADLLHSEKSLVEKHHALAMTLPARGGPRSFAATRARALRTCFFARKVQALLAALGRLEQVNFKAIEQIV